VWAADPAPAKSPADEMKIQERKCNEAWSGLSLAEKQWILRYLQAMREMPAQERQLIDDRFDRFLRMTPEERTIMKQNYAKWQALTPEQRQKAREEYARHRENFEAEWKKKHPKDPPPAMSFTVSSVPPAPEFYKDEFQLMILQLGLQGDQLKAFQLKVAERLKSIADWNQGKSGKQVADLDKKLEQARNAKDEAKIKSLTEQRAPLQLESSQLRVRLRADVMSVLTLEQQRQWAAFVLCDCVRYRNLRGIVLDAAQVKQAQSICSEVAAKFVKEDTIAKDPYLNGLNNLREDVANSIKVNVLGLEPPVVKVIPPTPDSGSP
jgi:Spy/CpxP family protein refolding chaperone